MIRFRFRFRFRFRSARRSIVFAAFAMVAAAVTLAAPSVEASTSYQRISGEGSSWAANAIDAMRVNVRQFGITVDFNPTGSSAGRKNFLNGTVDFAASDIPFQFKPEDGSAPENPAPGSYAYMPITAGGTAFMYNLKINGKRVTNLRLSGENVVKLFTGVIKVWNDPAIKADNPGLVLPAKPVVAVVRSDGSGSTAQFTKWMIARHGAAWNAYCQKSGRAPACGFTSLYPTIPGMIAQQGDLGVAGYISQGFAEGAIGYVNFSYALGSQFPVAKMLNVAGFYTEPTPKNVAVSLLAAKINTNTTDPSTYLTQDLSGVYTGKDPRNYELSSYSYLILPTKVGGQFNADKGRTLAAFSYYAMCQAQQQSESLGYSPMPINLVRASFDQIRKIPGAVAQSIDLKSCKNPTFSTDGTNTLAKSAPLPQACDKKGSNTQCANGTGGLSGVPTAVSGGGGQQTGGGTPTTVAGGGQTGGGQSGGGQTGGGQTGGGQTGGGQTGGGVTDSTIAGVGGATDTTLVGGTDTGGVTDTTIVDSGGPVDLDGDGIPDQQSAGQGDGGQSDGGQGDDGDLAIGPVTPTTIETGSSFDSALLLLLFVALMLVALVVAPAFAWRHFADQKGARS